MILKNIGKYFFIGLIAELIAILVYAVIHFIVYLMAFITTFGSLFFSGEVETFSKILVTVVFVLENKIIFQIIEWVLDLLALILIGFILLKIIRRVDKK